MKRYSLFLISLILLMTTGCNQRKEVAENPFFEEWETPYGVPPFDRIRPEHFLPAFQRAMSIQEAEIDAIKSNGDQPSFENVILAYDRSGLMLEQVGLVFNMLCSADVNDQLLAAKEQAMPLLAAHRDNILLDEVLFDKIKAVYDRRGSLGLDAVQTRLVEKIYGKFVRAGALLDPQQKERLRQINGELALLPVKFGNNVLRATNDFMLKLTEKQLDGLPASVQGMAREKAAELGLNDAWVVTLDAPSRIPFLTYSTQRDLREQLYKAYIDRCNEGSEYDNRSLVNDFARLRNEKARLLGYPSYAAYVTADEMAGTPAAVYELLNEVWTPALDRAKEEMAEMNTMLQRDVPGATFEPWDWCITPKRCARTNMRSTMLRCGPIFRSKMFGKALFRWRTGFTGLRSVRWSHRFTTRIARYMRCSTWTGLIWACSISTFFRAAARAAVRGVPRSAASATKATNASLLWSPSYAILLRRPN